MSAAPLLWCASAFLALSPSWAAPGLSSDCLGAASGSETSCAGDRDCGRYVGVWLFVKAAATGTPDQVAAAARRFLPDEQVNGDVKALAAFLAQERVFTGGKASEFPKSIKPIYRFVLGPKACRDIHDPIDAGLCARLAAAYSGLRKNDPGLCAAPDRYMCAGLVRGPEACRTGAEGAVRLDIRHPGDRRAGGLAPQIFTRDSRRYFYEDILEPFFAPDPTRPGFLRAQRPGADPDSVFPRAKPPNTLRVFIIGGSIAARYMGGEQSLKAALRRALPSRNIETISCGMGGYDSHRESLLVDEALRHAPDLIILMTGHNEAAASAPLPRWRLALIGLVERLREHRAAGPEKGDAGKVEGVFETNLRRMLRSAKAKGVPVAVCLPPLNYRNAPTSADLLSEPGFVKGWIPYLRGDPAAAEAQWEAALRSLPAPSPASLRSGITFQLGRCAERLGALQKARNDYALALDIDPLGAQGATPTRLAAMRRIALEEGAVPVDLDAAFKRRAFPRLPGLEMFNDGVHWWHAFDALTSLEILRALKNTPPLSKLPWDRRGIAACEELSRSPAAESSRREDEVNILLYALAEIGRQAPRLSWRGADYLEFLYPRFEKELASASRLAELVEESQPGRGAAWGMPAPRITPALLRWYRGEVLLRRGRFIEAAADLAQARRLDPDLLGIASSKAVADILLSAH